MAAKEIWDYLPSATVTADYQDTTLSITPDQVLVEEGQRNQIKHVGDDGSEEIIELDDTPVFIVTLQWDVQEEADSGTIFDFYWAENKAKCLARSFYWESPDGHKYTVKFNSELPRQRKVANSYAIPPVKLKILGRAP